MEIYRKRCSQIIAIIIVFVICFNVASTQNIVIFTDEEVPLAAGGITLDSVADFSNWRSGQYVGGSGKYKKTEQRICLNDYIEIDNNSPLKITVSNKTFSVLIRELDASYVFIKDYNWIADGDVLELHSNTKYLGISLYSPKVNMDFDKYKELFENGFQIHIQQNKLETDAEVQETETPDTQETENPDMQETEVQGTENPDMQETEVQETENPDMQETEVSGTEIDNTNINLMTFNDFQLWKSGQYVSGSGNYKAFEARICLNEYQEINAGQVYRVQLSNPSYRLLIRILDNNRKYVESFILQDEDTFATSSDAKYAGIVMDSTRISGLSYDKYRELFEKGINVGLEKISSGENGVLEEDTDDSEQIITEEVAETENTADSETEIKVEDTIEKESSGTESDIEENNSSDKIIDLGDFQQWRSGQYVSGSGKYKAFDARICLNDYLEINGNQTYIIHLSDLSYRLLIRVLDDKMTFMDSFDLQEGDTFTTPEAAKYVGISMYSTKVSGLSYDKFKELFEKELVVGLEITFKIDDSLIENNASSVEDIADSNVISDEERFKQEALYLMDHGVTDAYDVSKYNYTFAELDKLIDEVFKGPGRVQQECGAGMYFSNTRTSSNTIKTIKLEGVDPGYSTRLKNTYQAINEIEIGITDEMTNLEKALYVHDYIVSNASYADKGLQSYSAGGVLGDHLGVCESYSKAMILVLDRMGIEAVRVTSASMNHAWIQVRLEDGMWYHIDPTWNDTRSGVTGQITHQFFVKTDSEFKGAKSNKHYNWTGANTSASDAYADWFVHDVMGRMYYSKGMWYYVDPTTKNIVKSDIHGDQKTVLAFGGSNVTINSFLNGTLSYTMDGVAGTVEY